MLIPKIIHQVWDGPMLPGIQECLDSVKRVMPDYDVRVYDGEEVNRIAPQRMTLVGKTDVVRNKKLYEEGGWWVDADCYMMKPLNGDCAYSYGLQEQRDGCWNQVCDWLFGSEAGNPDQKRCLDWINSSQLVNTYDGYMRRPGRPDLYDKGLSGWGIDTVGAKGFLPYSEYGSRYFAKNYGNKWHHFPGRSPQRRKPANPTAVHLFLGSWVKRATGVLSEVKEAERWG